MPKKIDDSIKEVKSYLEVVSYETLIYLNNPDFIEEVTKIYDQNIEKFVHDVLEAMGYRTNEEGSPQVTAIPRKMKRGDSIFFKIHDDPLTNQPSDIQTVLSYLIDIITKSNGEMEVIVELLAKMHKNSSQVQDELKRYRQLAENLGTNELRDLYPTK